LTRAVRIAASQTCQSGAWRLCRLDIAPLARRQSPWENQLKPTARVRQPPFMLVYELYGLTEKEIALVEGNA
jgi:hypothetical protein